MFLALPKQDWSVSARVVITCTLPINLLEKVRKLAQAEKIENSSSFFRSCLSSYWQEKLVPPLPDDRGKEKSKSDYTFHVDKQLWFVWQRIPKGNRTFVLESWGWFLMGKIEGD